MFALYLQRQTVSFDVHLKYDNSCVNKFILNIVEVVLPTDLTPATYYLKYIVQCKCKLLTETQQLCHHGPFIMDTITSLETLGAKFYHQYK